MASNSAIEWTEKTWNPLLGCDRVSDGCDGCYAITTATIRAGNPHPAVASAFAGLTERRDGRLDWTGRVNLLPGRLDQPLKWRKPARIFVNSQADLFHDKVPDEFIAEVFAVMALAPQHTFQVLTKRHGRMRSLLNKPAFRLLVRNRVYKRHQYAEPVWPLPNVLLGVSVENQQWADIRIPALLATPAAVRWLSCEPLLGPIQMHPEWLIGRPSWGREEVSETGLATQPLVVGRSIDWVVVGGESGPGARPMHPDWARSLRDQCTTTDVPFFFKQWGQYGLVPKIRPDGSYSPDPGITVANDGTVYQPGELSYPDGPRYGEAIRLRHDRAHLHAMYRVGKMHAGRELDDRTWDEYPQAVSVNA